MRRLVLALALCVPTTLMAEEGPEGTETSSETGGQPESFRYPVPLDQPDFLAPGEPFALRDLEYAFSDTFATTHFFAARVKTGHWGLWGVASEGERREVSLQAHRLFLSAGGAEGSLTLSGRYRAPWFLLSVSAERRSPPRQRTWLIRPALRVRLSRSLELTGRMSGDSRQPFGHFLRSAAVGFFWQDGARLEMAGEYEHSREESGLRRENTRDAGRLSVVAQVGPAEIRARGALEDTSGLFSFREVTGALGARVAVSPRLLIEGQAATGYEPDVGLRSEEYRGGVTWFVRPFHLPRTGERAERAVVLADQAWERGLNERAVFDRRALREQRERLALAPGREELRTDMDAVYRAQVDERSVPSLGFEVIVMNDPLTGFRSRVLRATVAVPWPPTWPGLGSVHAVRFLRLDLERERVLSGPDDESIRHGLALTVSLNREMDLRLHWRNVEATPLDLIRGVGDRRTVEVAYVYAFGR